MTMHDAMTLAQQSSGRIIIAVLALVAVTIAGGVLILALRRRMMAEQGPGSRESLSLSQIRDLHARGELSDDEFDALRAAALGEFGYSPEGPGGEERHARPGVDLAGDPLPGIEPDAGDDAEHDPTEPEGSG